MNSEGGKLMPHINWLDQAENLIHGSWGCNGTDEVASNKRDSDTRLSMILLLDIAKSLRVLRCSNFNDTPRKLDRIDRELRAMRLEATRKRRCRRRHYKP